MRLVNVDPKTLIGRSIVDHLGHWWQVTGVDTDYLLCAQSHRNLSTKMRLAMLPRCRVYPTFTEVEQRYPLLIRALRWSCLLTINEAVGAVHGCIIHRGRNTMGSEAVAHIGGGVYAINHAWRCRHVTRELYAREKKMAA